MKWVVFDEKCKEILFYPLICITFTLLRTVKLGYIRKKTRLNLAFFAHLH